MPFQTISFFIGGAFLLAGLMMMAGRVRKILPAKLGKIGKPAGIAMVVFSLGIWAYNAHYLERAYTRATGSSTSAEASPGEQASKTPAPAKAVTTPAFHNPGKVSAEFVTPVDAPVPEAKSAPDPVEPDPVTPAASSGRPKRVVQSVGRFFHGHKKSAEE